MTKTLGGRPDAKHTVATYLASLRRHEERRLNAPNYLKQSDWGPAMLNVPAVRVASDDVLYLFAEESSRLDGMEPDLLPNWFVELRAFIEAPLSVDSLERFVASGSRHVLRDRRGMNFCAEGEISPLGGPEIRNMVLHLISEMQFLSSYDAFIRFKVIRPFSGGNGMAGRALWLWHMTRFCDTESFEAFARDGFLKAFYRQAVQHSRYQPAVIVGTGVDTAEIVTEDCAVMWTRLDPRDGFAEVAYAMSGRHRVVGLRVHGLAAANLVTGRSGQQC